jgi:hypothetical protein
MEPRPTQDAQNAEMNLTQIEVEDNSSLLETWAQDDSTINTMESSPTQDAKNTEMNLTQIELGDYSSLLGTWTQVAYMDSAFDGTGVQWRVGDEANRRSILSVSTDKIAFNGTAMIIQGNTLTDDNGCHLLSFVNHGSSLFADTDVMSSIYWSIDFYPKGIANNLDPDNVAQIDNTKNLIVILYNGMRVLTVFAQE